MAFRKVNMPVAKETSSFEPAPAGTHIARCYGCVSLGTQHSDNFADAFKVMLLFELPHERIKTKDGVEMPMTVSKEYSLSLNKKATLRKHLDAWRGRPFTDEESKGFEVSKVVGAPCQITIVHAVSGSGNTYAKIEAVTGLSKGTTCPPQAHKSVVYEIDDGIDDTFKALPEWIQKKITVCEEWTPPQDEKIDPLTAPESEDLPEDDVPF